LALAARGWPGEGEEVTAAVIGIAIVALGLVRVQRWFMASVLGLLAVRLVIDRGHPAPLAS